MLLVLHRPRLFHGLLGQTGPLGQNTPLSDFGLQEVDSVPAEWLERSPIPGGSFPVIGELGNLHAPRGCTESAEDPI